MEKLDFIIFVIIYMMVIGVVSSIFNPSMYSFGDDDYIGTEGFEQPEQVKDKNIFEKLWDFGKSVVAGVASIGMFLYAGFTMNIPDVPWIIKILMLSPIYGGMAYIIATWVRGGG